jgi:hypothetical protein
MASRWFSQKKMVPVASSKNLYESIFIASRKNLYENLCSFSLFFVTATACFLVCLSLFLTLPHLAPGKFGEGDSSVPDLSPLILIISGKAF